MICSDPHLQPEAEAVVATQQRVEAVRVVVAVRFAPVPDGGSDAAYDARVEGPTADRVAELDPLLRVHLAVEVEQEAPPAHRPLRLPDERHEAGVGGDGERVVHRRLAHRPVGVESRPIM